MSLSLAPFLASHISLSSNRSFLLSWDDDGNFVHNTNTHSLSFSNVVWMFTDANVYFVYEPFSLLFEALSHSLVGLDAPSVFLTNALLHSAVFLLAFALASALSSLSPSPLHSFYIFLSSAIFATHPLRAEVVAWLSCQPYLLASCFSLLSLLLYTPGLAPARSTLRSRLSLLFYALALLSKSAAVPVVA
ncbi:hypothetical protein TeGR_g3899, partial [Tetraparma gracilis]